MQSYARSVISIMGKTRAMGSYHGRLMFWLSRSQIFTDNAMFLVGGGHKIELECGTKGRKSWMARARLEF